MRWVMSHIIWWVMSNIWIITFRLTASRCHDEAVWHTCKCVRSHRRMRHITCEWVISHIQHGYCMAHIWMSRIAYVDEWCDIYEPLPLEWCHIYEHICEWCHIYEPLPLDITYVDDWCEIYEPLPLDSRQVCHDAAAWRTLQCVWAIQHPTPMSRADTHQFVLTMPAPA